MKTEKIFTPKTTGYLSLASFGTTILSGFTKNNTLRRIHKTSAYTTLGLTALHVGVTEYYSYKFKKDKKM